MIKKHFKLAICFLALAGAMLSGCSKYEDDPKQDQGQGQSQSSSSSKVAVTDVTLNKPTLTIKVGETYQFVPEVIPNNATNKRVTWTSGNTTLATISSSGLLTALKAGVVNIFCTTVDGNKAAKCEVTIKQ